jgi:hypothetical protein
VFSPDGWVDEYRLWAITTFTGRASFAELTVPWWRARTA